MRRAPAATFNVDSPVNTAVSTGEFAGNEVVRGGDRTVTDPVTAVAPQGGVHLGVLTLTTQLLVDERVVVLEDVFVLRSGYAREVGKMLDWEEFSGPIGTRWKFKTPVIITVNVCGLVCQGRAVD